MTVNEYKQQYPQNNVYVQTDDIERLMTDEEYDAWVIQCVNNINNSPYHS